MDNKVTITFTRNEDAMKMDIEADRGMNTEECASLLHLGFEEMMERGYDARTILNALIEEFMLGKELVHDNK